MTPSGWHDDAKQRDAGHDEMQVGVFKYLRERPDVKLKARAPYSAKLVEWSRVSTAFEHAFCVQGKIHCFADLCETFVYDDQRANGSVQSSFFYRVMEIKPRIYSVGALVRQCRATEVAIEHWAPGRGYYEKHGVLVLPCVKEDDEKLPLLLDVVAQVVTWDGESLKLKTGYSA